MSTERSIDLEKLESENPMVGHLVAMLEGEDRNASAPAADRFWTRQFPASGKGWG